MFDDIQKEPEDLFAETDAAAPQVSPPGQSTAPMQTAPVASASPTQPQINEPTPSIQSRTETVSSAKHGFPWKVVIMVLAIVIVIGVAFLLSMRILNSKTPTTPVAPETNQTVSETATLEEEPVIEQAQPVIQQTEVDMDKDGLSDVREAQLGTNPNNPDTDADGLFDKEEVDTYKTNPLNPDTDGDGYKDGDEVSKGYNPNGLGKLTELPQTP